MRKVAANPDASPAGAVNQVVACGARVEADLAVWVGQRKQISRLADNGRVRWPRLRAIVGADGYELRPDHAALDTSRLDGIAAMLFDRQLKSTTVGE